MKVNGGRIETVQLEQDGPIAFVESTTMANVFDEDENRCVIMHTDERAEQTRRIVSQLATAYVRAAAPAAMERIKQRHHALQRMLRQIPVSIPYAERLGEFFASERVEARRAFPQLMSMIQAVALLHQRQRQQDADGLLVATADDYQLARYLLLKPMARLLGSGLSDPAGRFYDRLSAWAANDFTASEAKRREAGSKSSVHAWLHELSEAGIVDAVAEARGRSPATWRLTGKTPDDTTSLILPPLEKVFPESSWKHERKPETLAPF
jgi:hypothetical protein